MEGMCGGKKEKAEGKPRKIALPRQHIKVTPPLLPKTSTSGTASLSGRSCQASRYPLADGFLLECVRALVCPGRNVVSYKK